MNLWRDIKGTFQPFWVTLRYLFKRPVTISYPEQKRTPPPRYRARMILTRDPDGEEPRQWISNCRGVYRPHLPHRRRCRYSCANSEKIPYTLKTETGTARIVYYATFIFERFGDSHIFTP